MRERRRLARDRVDPARVAMAERVDRDAGDEVEVLVALVVPQPRALASHELDRQPGVGAHHVVAVECLELRERHGMTFVPMPSFGNSSSSTEWGSRPSMMCAAFTPLSTASMQAATFGRIPPESWSIRSRTCSAVA